ncbi:hypothetical protein GCM10007298_11820 [Williamsia phyllosphaerae]|uniref:FHA domain-containing protein n=1 Tax=Williamsia phyllosphaerae TaxID=885042 RepID=A0ABQ1UGA9_9NOCA|nr:hypothetical protein GCM10007298_11820 [Williamsia phyllosphaerae]
MDFVNARGHAVQIVSPRHDGAPRARRPVRVTLTDIMPTLRMSIPDPIDLSAWPPHTSTTIDDVVVEGLSMHRVADLLGTPCDWTTTTSQVGCARVVLCRVSAVVHDGDEPIALVDCAAGHIGADWTHVRLIDRISVAHKGTFRVLGDGSTAHARPDRPAPVDGAEVSLPRDLQLGDLLIVPCPSSVAPASREPAARRAPAAQV